MLPWLGTYQRSLLVLFPIMGSEYLFALVANVRANTWCWRCFEYFHLSKSSQLAAWHHFVALDGGAHRREVQLRHGGHEGARDEGRARVRYARHRDRRHLDGAVETQDRRSCVCHRGPARLEQVSRRDVEPGRSFVRSVVVSVWPPGSTATVQNAVSDDESGLPR